MRLSRFFRDPLAEEISGALRNVERFRRAEEIAPVVLRLFAVEPLENAGGDLRKRGVDRPRGRHAARRLAGIELSADVRREALLPDLPVERFGRFRDPFGVVDVEELVRKEWRERLIQARDLVEAE